MTSIKQETITSVKWTSLEKFALQGMQFFIGLIMARLLTPSAYGTVAMLSIFMAVSGTFVDSGFSNALTRKLDRTEVDFSTIFYFNVFVACFFYIILFLIAPWVATFFNSPILCDILRIQAISLIINSFIQIQITKLVIELNFKALAIRAVLSAFISGIVGILLAFYGFGVWALVFQSLISAIVNALFIIIYCHWKPLLVFSKKSFLELGSYGSKLLASSLLHTIYTQLTTIIIGKFFSSNDLGYYNRGTQFAALPMTTFNSIIGRVTFPILVKLQNDDNRLIEVYRKYICIASLVIFFGCTMIAALAKPIIIILLTKKWAESIIYLQIYAFAIMFTHINDINLKLLQVKGRSDLFLKLEIIKKTISIAMLFAAIPFGIIGICVSKLIYCQIAIIINTYNTGKLFGLGYIKQVKDFSIYLIFSILACLPTFVVTKLGFSNFISLIFGCISCPLIYCFLLRKDSNMIFIVSIIKNKIKKHYV